MATTIINGEGVSFVWMIERYDGYSGGWIPMEFNYTRESARVIRNILRAKSTKQFRICKYVATDQRG